jgi:hypothetical protein
MSPNFFRQSFWAVFLPLLVVAGLFWMGELRGYRGEMTLLVLPKTEAGTGAAGNLVALSHETEFGMAVTDQVAMSESPFIGKTPVEQKKIWREMIDVQIVGTSDVIRVVSRGTDSDEAGRLAEATVAELVRTASRFYNQKIDIDIRIISDLAVIPSLTAWPHFVANTLLTAIFFTSLSFLVYRLIEWVFPKRVVRHPREGEYTITPETFKPRVPAYWGREESFPPSEKVVAEPFPVTEEFAEHPSLSEAQEYAPAAEAPSDRTSSGSEQSVSDSFMTERAERMSDTLIEQPATEESDVRREWSESHQPFVSYEAERAGLIEDEPEVSRGYVSHAAAPDNLPIVEVPITPLQGAQARLMKEDIDTNARTLAVSPELAVTGPATEVDLSEPQTHEPTPEEYRRRLNELLSGKM